MEKQRKLINTTVATFTGDTDMKMNFSEEKTRYINTMSLTGLSLMWGQMLGMLNPWFTPLTVLTIIIGYGSELNKPVTTDSNLH